LPKREELGELWGVDPAAGPRRDGVIDLSPADPSSQATVPFARTRPSDPLEPSQEAPVDPWSSRGGTLGRAGSGATVSYPPPASAAPVTRSSGGPAGCLLGVLAFLIIAAVAAVFAWAVAKPVVSDRVEKELDRGLSTQVAAIAVPTVQVTGQITLTEAEINKEIAGYAGAFDPVNNLRVRVLPDELRVNFDLYGVTSTYRGGLKVDNGKIVVVNPELSGPAGQVLDAQSVSDILETQLASLMARSRVQPTAVRLQDGKMTVTTRKA
jgi:hypothetical protein